MNFINPYDIIEIPILEFIRNMAVGLVLAVIFAWLVSKSTRLVVEYAKACMLECNMIFFAERT